MWLNFLKSIRYLFSLIYSFEYSSKSPLMNSCLTLWKTWWHMNDFWHEVFSAGGKSGVWEKGRGSIIYCIYTFSSFSPFSFFLFFFSLPTPPLSVSHLHDDFLFFFGLEMIRYHSRETFRKHFDAVKRKKRW